MYKKKYISIIRCFSGGTAASQPRNGFILSPQKTPASTGGEMNAVFVNIS
jgi:hypothetical protein